MAAFFKLTESTSSSYSRRPQLNFSTYSLQHSRPQTSKVFRIYRQTDEWMLPLRSATPNFKVGISAPPRVISGQSQALTQPMNNVDYESQLSSGSSNQGLKRFIQGLFQWRNTRISTLLFLSVVASVSVLCSSAFASTDSSIKASGIGLQIAEFMRKSGWPDEVIVFILASLPVLELRGAIPVGYWMQLQPFKISILAVLGNMVPIPFILLYLKWITDFVGKRSSVASSFLQTLVERTRKKAGPIEEFQWLGLMLFVAVPFPGTGAWSGAIAATVLDMPFWEALSANFFGVVFAGLLVNLLVNLGIKYAIAVGVILFLVSTIMWSFLRYIRKPSNNIN